MNSKLWVCRILMFAAGLAVTLPAAAVVAPVGPEILVLSNRADLISGGDALVEIRWPAGASVALAKIALDGVNVKPAFAVRPNGRYMGLVSGLKVGNNVLTARVPGAGAQITIKNHPIGGPVFSGTQISAGAVPWLCRTTNQSPSLGAPLDDDCNGATVVELFYRSTGNAWVAYNPANPPAPASVQMTTTDQGKTVPFIIQRVTGTANRGIYQIAVLVDPTKPITPWSIDQPWNHKYVNTFGGACGTPYAQPTVGDVRNVERLGLGFAVGTNSLNTFANSCSDLISAESLMMTKEIITERWGEILYTIGDGTSAGTMQQHMISSAYPGLLNGLMTGMLYEDHWFQVLDSHECLVLWRYFGLGGAAPAGWRDTANGAGLGHTTGRFPNGNVAGGPDRAQRQLVWGTNPANPDDKCGSKMGFISVELIAPGTCTIPPGATRWSPANPTGVRCTIADFLRYMFGVGLDGRSPRPLDNVGVQYGLVSLLNGSLTPDKFAHLNRNVGGMNLDGVWQPQRTEADPVALETIYRTGRIANGSGSAYVAEIDLRNNPLDTGFHPPFHSWTWRARIDKALGNHDNNVIWVQKAGGTPPSQFTEMRKWLDAVYSDPTNAPLSAKIKNNKPATTFDACYAPAAQGGVQSDLFCTGTAAQWQHYGTHRMMTGGPFTLDNFKCELKALDPADYPGISFTPEQWTWLQEAFPTGVCDYSKPGKHAEPTTPWVTFAGGPGGVPLGPPPTSTPIP